MTIIRYLMLFVLYACAHSGCGYDIRPPIPIQTPTPGIRYMPYNPAPQVRLEMFLDVHCGDSKRQWPILKQVQAHYGANKLDLIVQLMVLPYHRNAFLGTQGLYLIQNSSVSDKVFDYLEKSLEMEQEFSTANTVDMTERQVLDMMANMAVEATGINKAEFVSNIDNYRNKTVATWKFGVKHGVASTPTYFVNGVDVGIGVNEASFDDWIKYLDTIIPK